MPNTAAKTTVPQKSVHLVLSAGGVKTISYVGALQELREAGIGIKSVSCCSAGSLVGALLCGGVNLKELEGFLLQNSLQILKGNPRFRPEWLSVLLSWVRYPYASHVPGGFAELMEKLLGRDMPLKELTVPFSAIGVDIGQSNFVVFTAKNYPDMLLSEVVRVAMSLPGLWPPYTPSGTSRIIVDAAIATRSPSWLPDKMFNPDETDIPILVLRPAIVPNVTLKNGFLSFVKSLFQAAAISWDELLETANPRLRVIEINCGSFNVADFDIKSEAKQFLIDEGRSAMRKALSTEGFL